MVFERKALPGKAGRGLPVRAGMVLLSATVSGLVSLTAQAQDDPPTSAAEAASSAPELIRLPKTATHTVIRAGMPERSLTSTPVKVAISGFQVEGHPEISAQALSDLLLPLKGRNLTLPEFEEAVHAVAAYLREHGHPDATVSVSRSRLRDGVVAMAIQGLSPQAPEPAVATVRVQEFRVSGTELAGDEEFQQLLAPYRDKALTFDELQQLPLKVAGMLHDKGYVLAQAWLPPQRLGDGVLEIRVVDGKVDPAHEAGGIAVQGAGARIRPEVVRRFLADSVQPDRPLRVDELDAALKTVDALPGVASVSSTLVPGSQPGTTVVQVDVKQDKLLSGSLSANNYGDTYTGRQRATAHIDLNSPGGYGEQFSLDLSASQGMRQAGISASMPVGTAGARIGASASRLTMDIDPSKVPANLDSEATTFGLFGSMPLATGSSYSSQLGATVEYKHLQDNAAAFALSDREIVLGSLAWSGNLRDAHGGLNVWSLSGSVGDLDLSGEPSFQAIDRVTAQTEGGFARVNLDAGRLMRVGDSDWTWYTGFRGQFASKNLDSAEKFQLGGPTGVRAYPVGEGLGDHGWLITTELRRSLGSTVLGDAQVFAFADVGGTTQYADPWSGALASGTPNSYTLSGGGVGVSVSGRYGNLSLTAAHKIGENPNAGPGGKDVDGTDDQARIWIIGNIVF